MEKKKRVNEYLESFTYLVHMIWCFSFIAGCMLQWELSHYYRKHFFSSWLSTEIEILETVFISKYVVPSSKQTAFFIIIAPV